MTLHQAETPRLAEHAILDTEVITVAPPAPVFVDSTGRRSRLLRGLSYAFGALVMLYGGLISVSLAGGPVRSDTVLPLPGLEPKSIDDERAAPRPSPTPEPNPSRSPAVGFVTDALPRRAVPRAESTTTATHKPSASATPTAKTTTPSPAASTSTPTESATTAPASTPATPASTPTTPVPALPPSGGQGGGTAIDAPETTAAAEPEPTTELPTGLATEEPEPTPEVSA